MACHLLATLVKHQTRLTITLIGNKDLSIVGRNTDRRLGLTGHPFQGLGCLIVSIIQLFSPTTTAEKGNIERALLYSKVNQHYHRRRRACTLRLEVITQRRTGSSV